jgi:hypothetical protein
MFILYIHHGYEATVHRSRCSAGSSYGHPRRRLGNVGKDENGDIMGISWEYI